MTDTPRPACLAPEVVAAIHVAAKLVKERWLSYQEAADLARLDEFWRDAFLALLDGAGMRPGCLPGDAAQRPQPKARSDQPRPGEPTWDQFWQMALELNGPTGITAVLGGDIDRLATSLRVQWRAGYDAALKLAEERADTAAAESLGRRTFCFQQHSYSC